MIRIRSVVGPIVRVAVDVVRPIVVPIPDSPASFLIIIGIGYLTALSYLFLVDVEPHQKMGEGVVEGISTKYHGSLKGTRLEAALMGSMADKLSSGERDQVLQWIHAGATAEGYPKIEPVLIKNCGACHGAQSGLPILPLTSYEDVKNPYPRS